MVLTPSPEWEWARLVAGSGASHLSEEEQRSLGNKGTLPSLGLFLKRTLPAWNWLESWTAARMAHPRCRPVASEASSLLCPLSGLWYTPGPERKGIWPLWACNPVTGQSKLCQWVSPTSMGRGIDIAEGTEKKPWLHHHVTLEGSPPHSGPQASMLYDYDIPITVRALMAPSRQIWVRRVDSLRKTKNGLAAGQWLRKPATGAEAMAAGAQKQPGVPAHQLSPFTCTTITEQLSTPSSGPAPPSPAQIWVVVFGHFTILPDSSLIFALKWHQSKWPKWIWTRAQTGYFAQLLASLKGRITKKF